MKAKRVIGFLAICGWAAYTILRIIGWQYMDTSSKIGTVISTIILGGMLSYTVASKIHLIRLIIKVEKEHIPNLQRGLRRVYMYKHTRGNEYARQISNGQRILCDISIESVKHIKSQIFMPFVKKILDQKIKEIEQIKNQMVIL